MPAEFARGESDVEEQTEGASGLISTYTPIQSLFLARLKRLVALRESYGADPQREEWLQRIADKALYSAFRDCTELGMGEEAKSILGGEVTGL